MIKLTLRYSNKNNLSCLSKPHAYRKSMTKTRVKFQKNLHKIVGGVGIIITPGKGFQLAKKSDKIILELYKTTFTSSDHDQNTLLSKR